MKRAELEASVKNVFERSGVSDVPAGLEEATKRAAALAFARCLTEDDDTRHVRWQYASLVDRGHFMLED